MRLKIIKIFFITCFAAIILRLFFWQVVSADYLQSLSDKQHQSSVKVSAQRGNIFFSDGSPLALNTPVYTLFGQPKIIEENLILDSSYKIAKIFSSDNKDTDKIASDLIKKLSQDLFWVPLIKNVSPDLKKKVEDLKLKGFGFEQKNIRFYPEGSSAAHLLGFVGSNAKGEDTGYFGLEGYYEMELKGIGGLVTHKKDAQGLPVINSNFLSGRSRNGKDLVLNIDRSAQFIVEKALEKGMAKYGAKGASAIVMDPSTGAVLALAAYPNYNPSEYYDFPKEYYKNPLVGFQYEPGSTFKVVVMASAINEKVIEPETKCDICSSPIAIGGFKISTWNNKFHPDSNMVDVIVHSDNTGMVFVSRKLGLDKFYSYITDFGFGQSTDIDLEDEVSVQMREKNLWKEIDLATASFGQGIAVTPINMVVSVGAIANGGFLMEPHIVREIRDGENSFKIKPKIVRQVLSNSASSITKEMMVASVDKGEARVFKAKGYKVAGKTGTAQIPVAGHYDPNTTIASFVGFAPADNPRFVILVKYDEPVSSIYGAETAAPTFFEILNQLFIYYKIPPTE